MTRTTRFRSALLAAAAALVLTAPLALAGSGGGVFKLGTTNTVKRSSTLRGTASGPLLKLINGGTGAGLLIHVRAGVPPLKVNSAAKVAHLNADLLDGKNASAFLPEIGRAHV